MPDPTVTFTLPDGSVRTERVHHVLNAGFTGRDTEEVRRHVDELAAIGVPRPARTPTLYPLPRHLVTQEDRIEVQHGHTSGEAEWALVIGDEPDDVLVTAASDHTDRALEAHGIGWSKATSPNVLGDLAWYARDVAAELDEYTLSAWVTHGASRSLVQQASLAQLLPPDYWLDRLCENRLLRPGTVLLGGTIAMVDGVDPYAGEWRVELADPDGRTSVVAYHCDRLPPSWE